MIVVLMTNNNVPLYVKEGFESSYSSASRFEITEKIIEAHVFEDIDVEDIFDKDYLEYMFEKSNYINFSIDYIRYIEFRETKIKVLS